MQLTASEKTQQETREMRMRCLYVGVGLALLSMGVVAQGLPVERYLPRHVAIEVPSAALAQCKADGHAVSVEVMKITPECP